MPSDLINSALNLVNRIEKMANRKIGRTATEEEIFELNLKLKNVVPTWYCNLLMNVRLIDLEFGIQEFEPENDFDGVSSINWNNPKTIIAESLEFYPGILILGKRYFCIASCSHGSGDQIYIQNTIENDDPPVYRIFHDVSDDANTIIEDGTHKIADKLSDLFNKAIVEE